MRIILVEGYDHQVLFGNTQFHSTAADGVNDHTICQSLSLIILDFSILDLRNGQNIQGLQLRSILLGSQINIIVLIEIQASIYFEQILYILLLFMNSQSPLQMGQQFNTSQSKTDFKKVVLWRDMICGKCSQIFNISNRAAIEVCRRGHSFCKECLQDLRQQNGIYCPECFKCVPQQNIVCNESINENCQNIDRIRKEIEKNKTEKQRLAKLKSQMLSSIIYIRNNLHRKIKGKQLQSPINSISNIKNHFKSISNNESYLLNKKYYPVRAQEKSKSRLNQTRRPQKVQSFNRTKNAGNLLIGRKYLSTASTWRITRSSVGKSC